MHRTLIFLIAGSWSALALASDPWEPGANPWEPTSKSRSKAAPEPQSNRPFSFLIRPEIGYQVGATTYDFTFPATDSLKGSSQLDWPLASVMAGLQARLAGDGGRWAIQGSFATNMVDPIGTLLDRDWVSNDSAKVEFSHTDSATKARLYQGDITGQYQVGRTTFTDAVLKFDVLLGYRHEAFSGDGWGVTGWQLDGRGVQQSFEIKSDTKVGHYEYQRGMPHVGVGIRSKLLERFLMDVDAQVGLVISVDQDNHVLRNKLGDATSVGAGFLLDIVPRWVLLGSPEEGFSLAVGANLQLRLSRSGGKLKQHYYANDPGLPGVGPDTVIPDIDTTFSSVTGMAQAMVDVTF